MKLERSDVFGWSWQAGPDPLVPAYKWARPPMWRVYPAGSYWPIGPWCYSRTDAIWQFVKCNWQWYWRRLK